MDSAFLEFIAVRYPTPEARHKFVGRLRATGAEAGARGFPEVAEQALAEANALELPAAPIAAVERRQPRSEVAPARPAKVA